MDIVFATTCYAVVMTTAANLHSTLIILIHAFRSAMLITAGYTVGAVGGVALAGALYKPISTGGSIGVGLAFFAVVFLGCGAASYAARSSPEMTVTEWIGVWGLAGTRNLRRTFQVLRSSSMH